MAIKVDFQKNLYLQIYTNLTQPASVQIAFDIVWELAAGISKFIRSICRNHMNSIIDFLQGKYGSLMTIEQLAQALSRKPSGLRGVLQKPTEPWMFKLNRVKRRIGRRIYFPTDAVAALLNGDFDHQNHD